MSQHLVKMRVKVIPAVLLFVILTNKLYWLELYRMEVDVVKQENQASMEMLISSNIGFKLVKYIDFPENANFSLFS